MEFLNRTTVLRELRCHELDVRQRRSALFSKSPAVIGLLLCALSPEPLHKDHDTDGALPSKPNGIVSAIVVPHTKQRLLLSKLHDVQHSSIAAMGSVVVVALCSECVACSDDTVPDSMERVWKSEAISCSR